VKKPNLPKLLAKYQKLLRLQDFDISICYARPTEPGDVGRTCMRWHLGTAEIQITDPKYWTASGQHMDNIELTVVHELLHLMLQPLCPRPDGLLSDIMEQVIEKLAKAIVNV